MVRVPSARHYVGWALLLTAVLVVCLVGLIYHLATTRPGLARPDEQFQSCIADAPPPSKSFREHVSECYEKHLNGGAP